MSEINNLDSVGMKHPIGRLSSKTQVSMEAPQKADAVVANDPAQEIKKLEIKMEEAKHAFALMTEIRQKLEKQYQDLSPSE